MTWSLLLGAIIFSFFFFLLSPTRVHIKRNHSSPINFGARRDLRDKVVGPQL